MKVQRRLAFNYFIQFIVFMVAMSFLTVLLVAFIIRFVSNMEAEAGSKEGIITNISSQIYIYENEVTLEEGWHDVLVENGMWMQVVNEAGDVIFTINTPDTLNQSYTVNELLEITESGTFKDYKIRTFYDSWNNEPYYYLFGMKDDYQAYLKALYSKFSEDGLVSNHMIDAVEQELQKHKAFLQIYRDGKVVQSIGENSDQQFNHMELMGRLFEPGHYETIISYYNDAETGISWVLHLPNPDHEKTLVNVFSRETQITLIIVIVSFLFTLTFSIWNAHRYGRPLMLFVNWLKRMENQQYSEVFSSKEKKQIFKKNGKVRYRFRLYEEVIHSLKDLSNKLEQIESERKQLEQTREEWMTGISHDLRTPLSTIQGYGHILESRQFSFTEDELVEIGKGLREKSEHMLDMLNDFSLIFQIKNSVIQMDFAPIEANQYLKDVAKKFINDLTIKHKITLIPDPVPFYIDVDAKWFERVLDNIIFNSIKHNPNSIQIDISVFHDDQYGIIQIEDNGVGMDKKSVERLFTRYYRGTNTMEKNAGTGLGMSIAKGIVDLHKGQIEVQSELGIGTVVRIYVPLSKSENQSKVETA